MPLTIAIIIGILFATLALIPLIVSDDHQEETDQ